MNWDSLRTPVEVVNKLVLTLAIAIGGAWTWYTFSGELRRENAEAQLQKIRRDIELAKTWSVDAEVHAASLPRLGSERHVQVRVVFHNRGSRDAKIGIQPTSLRVTPLLTPNLPEQPHLAPRTQFRPLPLVTALDGAAASITSISLAVGSRAELLYVAQVDTPGRYLVEFSTSGAGADAAGGQDTEFGSSAVLDVP